MSTVEENIEKIRVSKGITKQTVIDGLNMSRQGYGKMLENRTTTVATLEKIADILQVDVADFFKKEGGGNVTDVKKSNVNSMGSGNSGATQSIGKSDTIDTRYFAQLEERVAELKEELKECRGSNKELQKKLDEANAKLLAAYEKMNSTR